MSCTFRHSEIAGRSALHRGAASQGMPAAGQGHRYAGVVNMVCWNGRHDVPQRSTRYAGVVDTMCRSGGHGVSERWTRCAGTVILGCWNGGHAGFLPIFGVCCL
ncbi:hypothetical protein [Kibdelosporangium philippinense]|uniref:hypothetical protein n=1 Tax=Kibdelosporangium philippinense TaxID=211113 RepID=UPI003616CD03